MNTNTNTQFTRRDYLTGVCSHHEYYAQFVTDYHLNTVGNRVNIERLAEDYKNGDVNLNSRYGLRIWDAIHMLTTDTIAKLRELGDSPSIAGNVCIAKCAAMILIERHIKDKQEVQ